MSLASQISLALQRIAQEFNAHGPHYRAADYGALGMTLDPAFANVTTLTTGRVFYATFKAEKSGTINKVGFYVNTLAATVTHAVVGIYSKAGVQLGVSADNSTDMTAITTTGAKQFTLTSGVAVTAGTEYIVAILVAATTMPALAAASSTNVATNFLRTANTNVLRSAIGTATLTALPSPMVFTSGWSLGNNLIFFHMAT